MNIRRKGTSAINEVHQKLLILQEENDRLRRTVMSVNDVENLMAENRQMKFELQKLKPPITGQSIESGILFFPSIHHYFLDQGLNDGST